MRRAGNALRRDFATLCHMLGRVVQRRVAYYFRRGEARES